MNDQAALTYIQAYFSGKGSAEDYNAALDYLISSPATQSRLALLYQKLAQPGGLDCDTSRAEMLCFLDPVDRPLMSEEAVENFLLHLSACVNCAEEYLLLSQSEADFAIDPALKIPKFKIPGQAKKAVPWPSLLKPLVIITENLKYKLAFSLNPQNPVLNIREDTNPYSAGLDRLTLFSQTLDEVQGVQTRIIATRHSDSTCGIEIVLEGTGELQEQSVSLSYGQTKLVGKTTEDNSIYFTEIPISAMSDFQIEITLHL